MKRVVFHFLAGVSLACFICLAGLWILSESREDGITGDFTRGDGLLMGEYSVISEGGAVSVVIQFPDVTWVSASMVPRKFGHWSGPRPIPVNELKVTGFQFAHDGESSGIETIWIGGKPKRWEEMKGSFQGSGFVLPGKYFRVLASYWLALLISVVVPAVWIAKGQKRRSLRRIGLCQSCGYDLRATPGRCPECGRVPRELVPAGRR